jgi:hypothetical protein
MFAVNEGHSLRVAAAQTLQRVLEAQALPSTATESLHTIEIRQSSC